jgi:8-oxo-dGTP diphosphatase
MAEIDKRTLTAGAIILQNGRILLVKRDNTRVFNGFWSLPGGRLNTGEDAAEAVKREIKEETNLDIAPVFFRSYDEDFPEFKWKARVSIFSGKFSGDVRINGESSDFGWFSPEEIMKMRIAYDHGKIIKDFIGQGP